MRDFVRSSGSDEALKRLAGAVVAIGNFDGCHLGHQRVFAAARALAERIGAKTAILTFEPHPRDVFAPAPFMFRLTPGDTKAEIARALGFDGVVIVPFDRVVAEIEAEDFVDNMLLGDLGARGVVVGADFHFGKKRGGSPEFLKAQGAAKGFAVEIVDMLGQDGDTVSSSRIRSLLGGGSVEAANRLLGYHWFFSGRVQEGDRLGRTLGYPTANLPAPPGFALAQGVYAVRARWCGRQIDGVASFGRPMFSDAPPPFEVHLFDFSQDIYGETLEVALISHIRGQMSFDGLEGLIAQMNEDSATARAALAVATPLSDLDRSLGLIIGG